MGSFKKIKVQKEVKRFYPRKLFIFSDAIDKRIWTKYGELLFDTNPLSQMQDYNIFKGVLTLFPLYHSFRKDAVPLFLQVSPFFSSNVPLFFFNSPLLGEMSEGQWGVGDERSGGVERCPKDREVRELTKRRGQGDAGGRGAPLTRTLDRKKFSAISYAANIFISPTSKVFSIALFNRKLNKTDASII
jgi:hypothetical protein